MDRIKVINFYKFIPLDEPKALEENLLHDFEGIAVMGTLILATEGLNGSLAGLPINVDKAFQLISSYPGFSDLSYRESFGTSQPYRKLVIRTKRQILTFPEPCDPKIQEIIQGPVMSPDEWHTKIASGDKDLILLDTRNRYEIELGSFVGAETLEIDQFKDFPETFLNKYGEQKNKTYLMFCTGGIRCEKAVAFAKNQGFQRVFQLDGGILNYLKEKGQDHWQGECFVFDQRWTIKADRDEGESFQVPTKV